jgi:hypothetical protein
MDQLRDFLKDEVPHSEAYHNQCADIVRLIEDNAANVVIHELLGRIKKIETHLNECETGRLEDRELVRADEVYPDGWHPKNPYSGPD